MMAAILSFLAFFQPLITYNLWSRLGFLFSYILTSLLVLEVLRLVYTDANKREIEKLLDAYSGTSTTTTATNPKAAHRLAKDSKRSVSPPMKRMRIPIDDLQRVRTPSPPAATAVSASAAVADPNITAIPPRRSRSNTSDSTLIDSSSPKPRKSSRKVPSSTASSSSSPPRPQSQPQPYQQQQAYPTQLHPNHQAYPQSYYYYPHVQQPVAQQQPPIHLSVKEPSPRRLRKRSDTLTSTGSSSSSSSAAHRRRLREEEEVSAGLEGRRSRSGTEGSRRSRSRSLSPVRVRRVVRGEKVGRVKVRE